jgi:hypothetical protein
MAAVKKVVIPRSQLIPVDGLGQALVRFRIISDDRNRFSEWSSIFAVMSNDFISLPALARFRSGVIGSIVTIAWDRLPAELSFDVFISDDGEDMEYRGTTSDNKYIFIISAAETYQFSVQLSSIRKVYEPSLQIFESEVFNVV